MKRIDAQTSAQLAQRLKALFDSARRLRRRSRQRGRLTHPHAFPREIQLELGLSLD